MNTRKDITAALAHAVRALKTLISPAAAAALAAIPCMALAATVAGALPSTAPGMLDPTFGDAGKTILTGAAPNDSARRLVVQPDGRYLIAGSGSAAGNFGVGLIERFTHDGKPDPTFYGTGGRVFGDASTGADFRDLALLPDGKIVLVGNLYRETPTPASSGWLTRLNADGSTDLSFGANGNVELATPGYPWVSMRNVAVRSDGKIVAIVQENDQSGDLDRPYVLRLMPDGTPDAAFGPGGRVYFDHVAPRFLAHRMTLLASGQIMTTGWSWTPNNGPDVGIVVRLNADGSADASFGNGGAFTYAPPGRNTTLMDQLVDQAGMVVVTGYTGAPLRSGFVIRLTSAGVPDPGFGFQGVVTLPGSVGAFSLARQADGKLVVGAHKMPGSDYQIALMRLLPNGAIDASFGTAGTAASFGARREFAYALAVDPDGKIVVSGASSESFEHAMIVRVIGTEITTPVIEFYNGPLNHYFITADPAEASAIDNGAAGPGWARTGQTFKSGGPNRVCRFYGSPETNPATGMRHGPNSHFYTIEAGECGAVKTDAGWKFESYDFNGWPIAQGSCPQGTQPIRRVYNQRFAQNDSNHRYITTDALYQQMTAQGWAGEGTVFCAAL